MDLESEPGSETGLREGGLGGTKEADTDERRIETSMMSITNQTGDSSCPFWLRKELQDAEFIPMPEDFRGSMPGPVAPSFPESVTLPYEELQELKAAAAAAATEKELPTARMGCDRVNGFEEAGACKKGEAPTCCRGSSEVAQLRETVSRQEATIQLLQKQFSDQLKENERLWTAINRLTLREAGTENNCNHQSGHRPVEGMGGASNHDGDRSDGANP